MRTYEYWEAEAIRILGITPVDHSYNRLLREQVPKFAANLAATFAAGEKSAQDRMRDFLDGKIPDVVFSSPTG